MTIISDAVERYVSGAVTRETPLQAELRKETGRLPHGGMMTPPDVAGFLGLVVRMTGARRALEIGTFTGYGSLAIASALPADGKLICCDISAERTAIAQRYWQRAGVAERIDLRIAPAQDTLAALLRDGATASFDFAFIDADKGGYDTYYEACLKLVRPGGVIALDNMLWGGAVADGRVRDSATKGLRALNQKIHDDRRVDAVLLTIGDGVMLACKR
jgi:predicted O-methyltransferase YrrM